MVDKPVYTGLTELTLEKRVIKKVSFIFNFTQAGGTIEKDIDFNSNFFVLLLFLLMPDVLKPLE